MISPETFTWVGQQVARVLKEADQDQGTDVMDVNFSLIHSYTQ